MLYFNYSWEKNTVNIVSSRRRQRTREQNRSTQSMKLYELWARKTRKNIPRENCRKIYKKIRGGSGGRKHVYQHINRIYSPSMITIATKNVQFTIIVLFARKLLISAVKTFFFSAAFFLYLRDMYGLYLFEFVSTRKFSRSIVFSKSFEFDSTRASFYI